MDKKIVPVHTFITPKGEKIYSLQVMTDSGELRYKAGSNWGGTLAPFYYITYRGQEYHVSGEFQRFDMTLNESHLEGQFQAVGEFQHSIYIIQREHFKTFERGTAVYSYIQEQILSTLEEHWTDELIAESRMTNEYNRIVKMHKEVDRLMAEEKALRDIRFTELMRVIDAMNAYARDYNTQDIRDMIDESNNDEIGIGKDGYVS